MKGKFVLWEAAVERNCPRKETRGTCPYFQTRCKLYHNPGKSFPYPRNRVHDKKIMKLPSIGGPLIGGRR